MKMRRHRAPPGAIVPALLALLVAAEPAQRSATPATGSFQREQRARLRDRIPDLLRRHRVPGLALAVVEPDGAIWTEAFGQRRAGTPDPVGPGTVFEAASLGKPLFAYGLMQLVQGGQLDLDAPVRDYFPAGSPVPVDSITLGHLLSHSAGLPNRAGRGEMEAAFAPGSRWRYSGPGYMLAQRALEAATGRSLGSYMEKAVFAPLGMDRSAYLWTRAYDTLAATGHDGSGRPQRKWRPDRDAMASIGAASTLHTTARDYARFLAAMIHPAGDPDLPGPRTLRSMLAPRVEVDRELGLWWGLGWAIERLEDADYFFHWGANPAFRSFALGSAETGRALVILTNGRNGLELADEVAEIVTGRRHPLFSFYMLHPTD